VAVGLALTFTPAGAQEPLQSLEGCRYVATDWADGDSFVVRLPDGRETVLRLYFVDCLETDVADVTGKRRLREQARYFGVEDFGLAHQCGVEARRRVAEILAEPFTVHTSFSKAPGRSGSPRHYAFITPSGGRDLGEWLKTDVGNTDAIDRSARERVGA